MYNRVPKHLQNSVKWFENYSDILRNQIIAKNDLPLNSLPYNIVKYFQLYEEDEDNKNVELFERAKDFTTKMGDFIMALKGDDVDTLEPSIIDLILDVLRPPQQAQKSGIDTTTIVIIVAAILLVVILIVKLK